MDTTSRAAAWSLRLGSAGLALLAIGALIANLSLVRPMQGFLVFQVGLLLGLVALVLASVGFWTTRGGRSGRSQALSGFLLGVAVLAIVAFSAREGAGVPPINDITTSPNDPPGYMAIAQLEPNRGRDMAYPGEEFAAQQRLAYPDLAPLRVNTSPRATLERVREAATALGWEIVSEAPEIGRLEATESTAVFRFVDDVVVRVRADGTGSIVDVRSKSRDGRGDLGANAKRIRTLLNALQG